MMIQASLFSELFKPIIIKDKHPDKSTKQQYSIYPCGKCGRDTFMKWIHWPTEKQCTECETTYILVDNEWRDEMTFIHQLANRLYSELVRIHSNGVAICTYDEVAEKLKCNRAAAIKASDLLCNTNKRITKEAINSLGNGDYVIKYTFLIGD